MKSESKLRSECVSRSSDVVKLGSKTLPKGWQLVAIVTDPEGKFVGVSGSHGVTQIEAILQCALGVHPNNQVEGDRVDHK
jgi:hypothetical protein